MAYYTEKGLDQLMKKLSRLKGEDWIRVTNDLNEASKKGDLKENAEYDAAKDAKYLLERRIEVLEALVVNARVLQEHEIDLSRVSILCKTQVKNKKTGIESVFMLVSEGEADLKQGKISINSPIGKGLLGKKIGEIALVEAPSGTIELEILKIGLEL